MDNKYYITTAIAYTSRKPHIGNTYEIVLTDAIARFKRLIGKDVFFLTGTDEHGQKMIAEGAGATAVAAAMFNKFPIEGKKVVSIVSGGNIDVTSLSRVIERGLMKSGRSSALLIELIDKPGQLKDVSRIIAECGGNVTSVHHERAGDTESVNGCYLRIEMETRNYEHVQEITNALKAEGFKIV